MLLPCYLIYQFFYFTQKNVFIKKYLKCDHHKCLALMDYYVYRNIKYDTKVLDFFFLLHRSCLITLSAFYIKYSLSCDRYL